MFNRVRCLPMFSKKTCNTCQIKKSLNDFHKDSKNRDGYSASCGQCRNERRRVQKKIGAHKLPKDFVREISLPKFPEQKPPTPTIQTQPSHIVRASVPIIDERSTILDAIHEKYGATFTITVSKDRTCHINIMQDGWKNTKKFRTPEELLACVL